MQPAVVVEVYAVANHAHRVSVCVLLPWSGAFRVDTALIEAFTPVAIQIGSIESSGSR